MMVDCLTCFENVIGPQAEKIKKYIITIFKQEFDLNITTETNLKNFSLRYKIKLLNGIITTIQQAGQ